MSCSRGETPSADGERPTKKVKFRSVQDQRGQRSCRAQTESDRQQRCAVVLTVFLPFSPLRTHSPQVSISEFLAVPAKDAVTFHALYGTTAAELDAEVRAGGTSFQCEFFNQVWEAVAAAMRVLSENQVVH